ncbi:hypothetical protein [Aeoliella sp. SH292]|uniref:hypothetical protein n=1 Tax=Aeoliella sp. SH292 TaxID=3454464 RepID=UPI003F98712A
MTIHYRGKLADPAQLETLEDLLIDLILELGGQVEVWRSVAEHDSSRVVRGLLVNIEPGQETLSLLFSPEGFLTPLVYISEAELGTMEPLPWCSIKTQYGTPVGHAAVVEILTLLLDHFLPDLEVHDETEYWEHRDPQRMIAALNRNAMILRTFADALENTHLTDEALESPEIVATRIDRIALLVQAKLKKPSPAIPSDADESDFQPPWPQIEAEWQELVRHSEARARRFQRTIEERLLAGDDVRSAFEAAEAKEMPDIHESLRQDTGELVSSFEDEDGDDEAFGTSNSWAADEQGEDFSPVRRERDPLLERATQLYMTLANLTDERDNDAMAELLRHAGELCGGLAQALPLPPSYDFDLEERGHAAVQLKRALRGAAFLRGALIHLTYVSPSREPFDSIRAEVETVQGEIINCLQQTRPMPDA